MSGYADHSRTVEQLAADCKKLKKLFRVWHSMHKNANTGNEACVQSVCPQQECWLSRNTNEMPGTLVVDDQVLLSIELIA